MDIQEFYRKSLQASGSHVLFTQVEPSVCILQYRLIKTERRLTFDILFQHPGTRYRGDDDGEYFTFVASNGYDVISRSRMDIQTERLWLLGASDETRSGTMVFSDNEKRDRAYEGFQLALEEWSRQWGDMGYAE